MGEGGVADMRTKPEKIIYNSFRTSKPLSQFDLPSKLKLQESVRRPFVQRNNM